MIRPAPVWVLLMATTLVPACASASGSGEGRAAVVCPTLEGRWPYGPCRAVAVQGSRAYIGSGTVFTIVDASDPNHPTHAGEVVLPGLVEAIALDLPLAYVANGAGEFQVVHEGTPNAPYIFSSLKLWPDSDCTVTDVAHSGNYCYLVDGHSLYTVDVTDPARPVRRGWTYEVRGAYGLALRGNYAVTVGMSGLSVVDLLDPDEPRVVGSWTEETLFRPDVEIAGNYAYVSDEYGKLHVVDVYNPMNPVRVACLEPLSGETAGVCLGDGYAYLPAGKAGVQVVDLSNPALPALHYTHNTPGEARRGTVAGGKLYLADGGGGLRLFESGGVLREEGSLPAAGPIADSCAAEALLYVADSSNGLRILDLQSTGGPTQVGFVATPGSALGVTVTGSRTAGRYALVADDSGGLRVIDASDPAAPSEVGSHGTWNKALSVEASWPYAFVGTYGLTVFDLSDPANPVQTGTTSGPCLSEDLAVAGPYVFAAGGTQGIQVFSVADKAHPTAVGSAGGLRYAYAVAYSENYLYVVDYGDWQGGTGLHIFDAADPTQLVQVAAAGPAYAVDVFVSGNAALVVDQDDGLHIYDVSNPHAPLKTGTAAMPGRAWSVEMWGGRAVVSSSDAGVSVMDLSNPCLPGDCNLDGTVSIGEVQKAINMFLGIEPVGCGADCNGDGAVSIGEVQKVINAFLGVATSC